MTDDPKGLLQNVRKARGDFEARADELEAAREAYYRAVARLHEAGMPLREIAEELGLSHQRVHQMVGESDRRKKLRKAAAKAARVAGALLLTLALVGGGFALSRAWDSPRDTVASPQHTHPSPGKPDHGKAFAPRTGFSIRFDKRDHLSRHTKRVIFAIVNDSGLLGIGPRSYPPLYRRPR